MVEAWTQGRSGPGKEWGWCSEHGAPLEGRRREMFHRPEWPGEPRSGGVAAGEEGGGGIVSLLVSWRPLPGLGGKKEWYSLKEEKGEFP